ncbi:MAG TPA: universal stress protein [Solirubrobacteraceae bacterium]|nr:universal stress protein [Solirubrobacteraceae bacterium]
MTALELGVGGVLVILAVAGLLAMTILRPRRHETTSQILTRGPERILFPYVPSSGSTAALDVALRLARAETGTLVPVFLARVPLRLSMDAPLPRQAQVAVPMQDQIEARAAAVGVPVDSRIQRGRSLRHALRETIAHERFDRIVVAAGGHGETGGFDADDIAWLLRHAPGEIVVLRGAD